MHIQNSYKADESLGKLYLVPTPIGNLQDMTFRAIDILKSVDMVLAEDTRHTKRLFQHFEINQVMQSMHEHNTLEKVPEILKRLESGEDIALVSDAGMPAISDPGYELVRAAVAAEMNVITLPGANAALVALVSSGLPTDRFYFHGFLPKKKSEKEKALNDLKALHASIVFYESPYRVKDTVQAILKTLGERKLVIAREITKLHESYIRGRADDVLNYLQKENIKGECCIVLEGQVRGTINEGAEDAFWQEMTFQAHVAYYETKGMTHKEAMKCVAKDRGISKRDVYQILHVK